MKDSRLRDYRSFILPLDSLEYQSWDLSKETNLFIRLKKYIIYLRRKGTPQLFFEWQDFFYKNIKEFVEVLESRELVSMSDCFIDWGNDLERGLALSIASYIHQEKRFLTIPKLFNLQGKGPLTSFERAAMRFTKGNLNSIRITEDDSIIFYYEKMFREMSKHEALYLIWRKIFITQITNPESSIALICGSSDSTAIYHDCFKELLEGKFQPRNNDEEIKIEEELEIENDQYSFLK